MAPRVGKIKPHFDSYAQTTSPGKSMDLVEILADGKTKCVLKHPDTGDMVVLRHEGNVVRRYTFDNTGEKIEMHSFYSSPKANDFKETIIRLTKDENIIKKLANMDFQKFEVLKAIQNNIDTILESEFFTSQAAKNENKFVALIKEYGNGTRIKTSDKEMPTAWHG